MTYAEKLKDPRWTRKKTEILTRDDFTCQNCESREKALHVHHVHYQKGDPWNTDSEFLMTVCDKCHKVRGELEARAKIALARILRRLVYDEGNEEGLLYFVQSLEIECTRESDVFDPFIININEFDYRSEIRWFSYAYENPSGRKMYEQVLGRKVKWPKKGK